MFRVPRPRRVSARLPSNFHLMAPNESHQSKGAQHTFVRSICTEVMSQYLTCGG